MSIVPSEQGHEHENKTLRLWELLNMRLSDLLSSEECEMELNGALKRAEHLRQRNKTLRLWALLNMRLRWVGWCILCFTSCAGDSQSYKQVRQECSVWKKIQSVGCCCIFCFTSRAGHSHTFKQMLFGAFFCCLVSTWAYCLQFHCSLYDAYQHRSILHNHFMGYLIRVIRQVFSILLSSSSSFSSNFTPPFQYLLFYRELK